jgi:capsular exopolysaccharide synthesis family protein
MSRLFEALQTYAADVSGEPLQDAASIPTDLLRSAAIHDASPVSRKTEDGVDSREHAPSSLPNVRTVPSDHLVSMGPEHSLAAEKFRFLAVRLRYLQQRSALKRVLVTSTIAGEGKSFVATNLAVTLARKQRQKVLLIEGDLRRPSAARMFGLPQMEGLCELLAEPQGGDKISYLQEAKIWFIPAGSAPENPLELMQSSRLTELMNRVSARFDWIIVDSPPILPLGDTTVWSRVTEGTLLVTREGKTQKSALKRGLEALNRANVIGFVLNSCSSVDEGGYYGSYGGAARSDGNA